MLNFNRRDRAAETPEAAKTVLKPAIYEPPGGANGGGVGAARSPPSHAAHPVEAPRAASTAAPAPASAPGSPKTHAPDAPESRLFVGVNIKLKGVEICDCDALVIEGHVEATVHSKVMEIAKPGTLRGNAQIDIAEIHGEFVGELTVRTRLTIHSSGRVAGTIRYGKLIVAEGGEVTGDVKRIDAAGEPAATETSLHAAATPMVARTSLSPSSERWSN